MCDGCSNQTEATILESNRDQLLEKLKNHRLIPRGCTAIQNEPSDLCHDADKEANVEPSQSAESGNAFDAGIGLDANDVSVPLLTPIIEPSLHVLAQKAAIASWSDQIC